MDTRERILATARHLFATDEMPTLGDVARRAGVSRATLHRHFRSRDDLLRAADVEPEPGARQRAVAAGLELLARDGLAQLSMDEVAERAEISRANLYRLFPGKAALFTELIRLYSPLEPIRATVAELPDQPPEVVLPAVAHAVAHHLESRLGLVRALFFEVAGQSSDAEAARLLVIHEAVAPLAAYLLKQMELGRLRRVHPLLAVQSFAGPLMFHLVLRPIAAKLLAFDVSVADAVNELTQLWLQSMRPNPSEGVT